MKHPQRLWIGSALLALASCRDKQEHSAARSTGGDPSRGGAAIGRYGCASCHTIPGIRGANALVGPPLDRVGSRTYIAGVMANSPQNMMRWLRDPPGVDPLTAMPNLHVTEADARDIASFLATLR